MPVSAAARLSRGGGGGLSSSAQKEHVWQLQYWQSCARVR